MYLIDVLRSKLIAAACLLEGAVEDAETLGDEIPEDMADEIGEISLALESMVEKLQTKGGL